MNNCETFGQVLSQLLHDKKYTIKALTQQMNLKSSNTIARLLADKSSPQKITSFCDALIQNNPMQLVDYEKKMLLEAVAISTIGINSYRANKQMLYFVQEHAQSPACICRQAFGDGSFFISTLDDLFTSYIELKSIYIYLQNCALGGVTRALKLLLELCVHTEVTVEHYVNTNEDRLEEVSDFLNFLDVMGHPNYNFFFSTHRTKNGNDFNNVHDNIMVILKCDQDGNKFTDTITFHSENSFTMLYNAPGEACYQFHLYQAQALHVQHIPAKAVKSNSYSIEGMLDYNQTLLDLDQSHPLFSIRPDISQCMLPPDIVQSTIRTLCTKPCSEEQNLIHKYIDVMEQRYQIFSTSGKVQKYLFSRSGLYNFLKYGKSKANVFALRDLTFEERYRVIENIIKVGEVISTTTFHLIKNELNYNNAVCLLYGSNTLFVNNYPGFLNYDPERNCHSCWIHSKNIIDSFDYFAENELLSNYVYSNEETLSFLKSLLKEY